MAHLQFRLNGEDVEVDVDNTAPLLTVLRNDLKTTSPRYGCGQEQCGACRVIVDGELAHSCTLPMEAVAGKSVTTLEGLTTDGRLDALQEAFIDENAGQCGFCLSGVIVTAKVLLSHNPNPTRREIQTALDDNLCRCGAHNRMIRAIQRAAATERR